VRAVTGAGTLPQRDIAIVPGSHQPMPDASAILPALLVAVVPSLIYLVVLNAIDRYEPEPWTILLACIGMGAVVAPIIVLVVFVLAGRAATLPPAFAPGLSPDAFTAIVEEVTLGILLIVLVRFVRDEFDDVLDGVIYGAAIGAGFGAAESFLYVMGGTGMLSGETVVALVVAGLNHAFYMAVFGAILAWAQPLPRTQRWIVTVLGLATAAWLHAFHDTLPLILSRVLGQPDAAAGALSRLVADLVNWLGLLMLAVVVVVAWRRESRILKLQLEDEVTAGVVTEADYATITSFGGRLGREATRLRTGGPSAVMRLHDRYAAEGELAFHKWRLTVRNRKPPPVERGDALRAKIRSLADELPGGAA
jgi:RsiW-degrading membrane proteinase PrsW (M82 family)